MGLSGGLPPRDQYTKVAECRRTIGRYHWRLLDDTWEWDEGVYAIHGLVPGDVVPSFELLLAHKHPADLAVARGSILSAIENRRPWSCRHRVVDAQQQVHTVVTAGDVEVGPDGAVTALTASMVDVTLSMKAETKIEVDHALAGVLENRTSIDEAKGALMLGYGMDADTAFELLRSVSQRLNVKVHRLAEEIVEHLPGAGARDEPPRAVLDQVLRGWTGRVSRSSRTDPVAGPRSAAG